MWKRLNRFNICTICMILFSVMIGCLIINYTIPCFVETHVSDLVKSYLNQCDTNEKKELFDYMTEQGNTNYIVISDMTYEDNGTITFHAAFNPDFKDKNTFIIPGTQNNSVFIDFFKDQYLNYFYFGYITLFVTFYSLVAILFIKSKQGKERQRLLRVLIAFFISIITLRLLCCVFLFNWQLATKILKLFSRLLELVSLLFIIKDPAIEIFNNWNDKKSFERIIKVKRYLKDIGIYCDFKKVLKVEISFFTLLITADTINVITRIINTYNIGLLSLSVVLFGILGIGIIFFIDNGLFDLIKTKSVNELDSIFVISLPFLIIYLLLVLFGTGFKLYKIIVLSFLILSIIAIIIYRLYKTKDNDIKINKNIYDLKDVYNFNLIKENNYPILLSENDVSYDLFERDSIIKQLLYSIYSCKNTENTFVIGLEGLWGSGKTTIINNVKQYLYDINDENTGLVVCDFDPWTYNSEEALLVSLFDTILKVTGVNYSSFYMRKITTDLMSLVLDKTNVGKFANRVISHSSINDSIETLKNKINSYLIKENKTIVLFIDNIDRASADNIILLFKLISNIFDLKRIVYVLSYDKSRVNDILDKTLDIDKHYIEKIVQQEIPVTKLSKNSLNDIASTCVNNILKYYVGEEYNSKEFDYIVEFIVNYIPNIRMLKRMINSAFSITFMNDSLYKPDLLTLEVIRFIDNELYDLIKNNHKFFVSMDNSYDSDVLITSLSKDEFNKSGKEFFDKIKKYHSEQAIKLLANVFPYVDNYIHNRELFANYTFLNDEYKSASLNSRVYSAKYFDLYFSYGNNEFISATNLYKHFIDLLGKIKIDDIPDLIDELFEELPESYHFEIINKLWLNRTDFKKEQNFSILIGLANNIFIIERTSEFFSLSPYERTTSIMSTLFSLIGSNEKEMFLQKYSNDYRYFGVLDRMAYWLKSDNNVQDFEKINNLIIAMYNQINNNLINLYSDEYYVPKNIWAFVRAKKKIYNLDDSVEIVDYVNRTFQPQCIYRMLSDMIGFSTSTLGYSYSISDNNLKTFFTDTDIIDNAINEYSPSNEIEKFIACVYEEFKNGAPNDFGQKEITLSEPIDLW